MDLREQDDKIDSDVLEVAATLVVAAAVLAWVATSILV